MEIKDIKLTEKTSVALAYLQANEGQYLGSEIAAATDLNPKGIHGVMNSLVKSGLVDKVDQEIESVTVNAEGVEKKVTKTLKAYFLTEKGRNFVIAA